MIGSAEVDVAAFFSSVFPTDVGQNGRLKNMISIRPLLKISIKGMNVAGVHVERMSHGSIHKKLFAELNVHQQAQRYFIPDDPEL